MGGQRFFIIKKNILFSIIAVLLTVFALEFSCRIWYAVRYCDLYWLFFGTHYSQRLMKIAQEARNSASRQKDIISRESIKVVSMVFHQGYWTYKPGLGYVRMKNSESMPVKINSLGLRGSEIGKKKAEVMRIVILGGSAVFGASLNDDETISCRLSELLGERYEVINAGIMGANSGHIAALLKDMFTRLDPDIVMLCCAFNDHSAIAEAKYQTFLRKVHLLVHKLLYWRSLIYTIISEKISFFLNKRYNPIHLCTLRCSYPEIDKKIAAFKTNLQEINTLCEKNKIKLILIKQALYFPKRYPSLEDSVFVSRLESKIKAEGELPFNEYTYLMQSYLLRAEDEIAQQYRISLIDCVSAFKHVIHKIDDYFYDIVHPNSAGALFIAETIYNNMQELRLFD